MQFFGVRNMWHENAPGHTSLLVYNFLFKKNAVIMPQPMYSSVLAPSDIFPFPKLKRTVKGQSCSMVNEIKT